MSLGLPGPRSLIDSDALKEVRGPQDVVVPVADLDCCGHDCYATSGSGGWRDHMAQEVSVIWTGEATVEEACARACAPCDETLARDPGYHEKSATQS